MGFRGIIIFVQFRARRKSRKRTRFVVAIAIVVSSATEFALLDPPSFTVLSMVPFMIAIASKTAAGLAGSGLGSFQRNNRLLKYCTTSESSLHHTFISGGLRQFV